MAPDYEKNVPDYDKKVPEFEKKAPESDKKYLKKTGGHIGRNVVQITIKMRTIVQITLIILYKIKRVSYNCFRGEQIIPLFSKIW